MILHGGFHGGGLAKKAVRQCSTLSRIFAVIRLNHKHLSNFYCRKRIFSRGTKSNNASEEALSKCWLNRCRRRRFSTNRNPFSWNERTRNVENIYGTRCYLALWSCFLLPLATPVDSTFVAGTSDENDRSEIAPLSAGTRHDITQEEHQGISLGATRRALP